MIAIIHAVRGLSRSANRIFRTFGAGSSPPEPRKQLKCCQMFPRSKRGSEATSPRPATSNNKVCRINILATIYGRQPALKARKIPFNCSATVAADLRLGCRPEAIVPARHRLPECYGEESVIIIGQVAFVAHGGPVPAPPVGRAALGIKPFEAALAIFL